MQLSLQNFTTLVQNMAAAVQSAANQLLDLTVGSTLRAILEANASLALWLQWLILQVLQTTRAATSTGSDLDTWMADFSLARLPAVPASGIVTFSRFTPLAPALVPVGAAVRTADGSQVFSVVASPASSSYSAEQNGYALGPGIAALDVPVVAQTAGAAGNVQVGAISLLSSALPGVDSVANVAPIQNGMDAETDAAFRARFQNFIASRSRATPLSIGYAITSIQQGLEYTIQENVDAAGNAMMGNFVVTVDDGSGAPSAALLASIASAVDSVRPVGSTFLVRAPTIVKVDVSLSISVANGADRAQVINSVSNAVMALIDGLPIGATLPLTRLAQVAYTANPGVINVTNLRANGSPSDVIPPTYGVVKAGLVAVN
jgi:uncharacterized phage protein gp47/JayE